MRIERKVLVRLHSEKIFDDDKYHPPSFEDC